MPSFRWLSSFAPRRSRTPARKASKAGDSFRPQLEQLEDRIVPSRNPLGPEPPPGGSTSLGSDRGVSSPQTSTSQPQLLIDLATQRHFIDYAPSGYPGDPFNPQLPGYPNQNDVSTTQITNDLQTLSNEGWRGIVTYSMTGNLQSVPQIAHQAGFTDVIVGLSDQTIAAWNPSTNTWNGGTAPQEYQNAINPSNLKYINGIVVGNEGLLTNQYSFAQLQGVMGQLRSDLQKEGYSGVQVTTTEPANYYLPPSSGGPLSQQQWLGLLQMSDWLFPNEDLYNGPNTNVSQTVTNAANLYYGILYQISLPQNGATQYEHKLLVYKESFWPNSYNGQNLSQQQVQYFSQLASVTVGPTQPSPPNPAATHVYFIWGEAYDQYWKNDGNGGLLGPYWGYHATNPTSDPTNPARTPELIVSPGTGNPGQGLQGVFTAAYPSAPPNFPISQGTHRPER